MARKHIHVHTRYVCEGVYKCQFCNHFKGKAKKAKKKGRK